ncbi:TIGR00645 family protein [Reyranella sp.]|uniref:TIGR00645 family protein n=1 Tax=Reyranella sp. TaxID=1929291 RepID=UPI0027231DAA|nr:TIGR00645 family protein [Reyranella sp.]MDO8974981.1 TIGR00645 family protein [Reyranella sp.]
MSTTPTKKIEVFVERIVMGSRWLQAPLYIGLVVVLGVVVVKFPFKIWDLMSKAITAEEADLVLAVLSLVDLIMVANLVVMVIISGYENFVSHIDVDGTRDRLAWFGKLDAGSLKIKLASSIVAISSIHLLQRFLEAGDYDNSKLYALVVMHMAFVVSALMLTYIDKIAYEKKAGGH